MTGFTLKMGKNLPVHDIVYSNDEDYVVVVGARTSTAVMPWDDVYAIRRGYQSSPGNQYRFINQGLLQLSLFPKPSLGNTKKQRILVVFQQGYTPNDVQRITEYTKDLNARIVYVKNVQELIVFFSQRIEKKRSIKHLVIFSHGLVGKLSFHYGGDREEDGEFSHAHIAQVRSAVFHYDGEITSYACRTGIGRDGSHFANSLEAHPEESLAQHMANAWMVKVRAFEKRSSYAQTYGTKQEAEDAHKALAMRSQYEKQQSDYARGISKKPPSDFLRAGYEARKERADAVKTRDDNEDTDGGPIMPLGAWHLPTSGETPTGLKNGLQVYQFIKAP
jgi:hypothetical protein